MSLRTCALNKGTTTVRINYFEGRNTFAYIARIGSGVQARTRTLQADKAKHQRQLVAEWRLPLMEREFLCDAWSGSAFLR